MDITLRKANAIQDLIRDAITSLKPNFVIDINEFQDVDTVLAEATAKLFDQDERRSQLLSTLYEIRGSVGQANTRANIDLKLAESAHIEKRITQLDEFKRSSVITDIDVIKGKLEKIKSYSSESRRTYLDENEVRTYLLTQQHIDDAATKIQVLRKNKQKLNDEVLSLNISRTITLSDNAVKTLTNEGIL
jgi:hypothetical protein